MPFDSKQKGLAPVLLLFVVAVVGLILLVATGRIKLPSSVKPPGAKDQATVQLENEYKNPFDKDNQYVNPFSKYKNPFDSLR